MRRSFYLSRPSFGVQFRSDVPTINVAGYLGADGLRYDLESEDSPYASTIDKLQRMQYLEFASKVQ